MRLRSVVLFAPCLVCFALSAGAELNTTSEALTRVVNIAQADMKEQQVPGLALVISRGDEEP
ncbi:MAG: hypothetical protein AVDCRST_MAG42-2360 [uncultured Chthoniobacterales bacterium]|uniref:Beta-lactamase class C-like and penicillin binding proteins (PBPs) superfamily n=1 Tax=uncultured Chthoniobacterales bacterium TaxID=1836801 RepID=A0A6J4IL95_9BACT|nr:MAG: hypothetical protein AVDCRST_MAG42-2360 [uncultured Chthoniobacterales bacterium]